MKRNQENSQQSNIITPAIEKQMKKNIENDMASGFVYRDCIEEPE